MTSDRNPSTNGRFPKGHSGNPKGRPRKETKKEVSVFDILLDRTLTVMQDGVPREITVEEALHHRIYQEAIGGSRLAQRRVLGMIAKREKARTAKLGRKFAPNLTVRIETDPENADAALEILGIAIRDGSWEGQDGKPGRLRLESWAVQAALVRRRGGHRLGQDEVKEIVRCTRDATRLRWPRGYEE
jgi:Family of unknown function (DUF5681)